MAAVAAPLYQARVVVPGNAAANNNNNAVPNNNNNDVDNRRHDDNDVVELQDDVDDKLEPALCQCTVVGSLVQPLFSQWPVSVTSTTGSDCKSCKPCRRALNVASNRRCPTDESTRRATVRGLCCGAVADALVVDFNAHLALRREFERLESLLAVVELVRRQQHPSTTHLYIVGQKCVALEGRDEHTFTARVPPHSSVAGLRRFIEDSTGRVVDELLVFGSPLPPDAEMTSLVDLEVEVVFGGWSTCGRFVVVHVALCRAAAAGVAVACHKCQTVSNSDVRATPRPLCCPLTRARRRKCFAARAAPCSLIACPKCNTTKQWTSPSALYVCSIGAVGVNSLCFCPKGLFCRLCHSRPNCRAAVFALELSRHVPCPVVAEKRMLSGVFDGHNTIQLECAIK